MKLFNLYTFIRNNYTITKLYGTSAEFVIQDSYNTEKRFAKFASDIVVNELSRRGYKVYYTEENHKTSLVHIEYPVNLRYNELSSMSADKLYELTSSIISDAIDDMNIPEKVKKIYLYRVNIALADVVNFKLRVEMRYRFK